MAFSGREESRPDADYTCSRSPDSTVPPVHLFHRSPSRRLITAGSTCRDRDVPRGSFKRSRCEPCDDVHGPWPDQRSARAKSSTAMLVSGAVAVVTAGRVTGHLRLAIWGSAP